MKIRPKDFEFGKNEKILRFIGNYVQLLRIYLQKKEFYLGVSA